ncbi:MAG: hypothetical protein VB835_03930, partial [Pirellulales bacterium]
MTRTEPNVVIRNSFRASGLKSVRLLTVTLLIGAAAAALQAAPATTASAPTEPEAVAAAANKNGAIAGRNLIDIIQQGGPLMIPILICSVVLFLFVFERFISLRRHRVIPKPFVKQFLHELRENVIDQDDALDMCEENDSP